MFSPAKLALILYALDGMKCFEAEPATLHFLETTEPLLLLDVKLPLGLNPLFLFSLASILALKLV